MSLRAKFLVLFAALAVVPLVAIGIFNYIQSQRALEDLVAAQVAEIAQRAATDLNDRFSLRESDLLLLAENAETQRLYRVSSGREPGNFDSALLAADAYLSQAWQLFEPSYAWIESSRPFPLAARLLTYQSLTSNISSHGELERDSAGKRAA